MQIFISMNMLQFNPAANLPMSVIKSASGDISNFLTIFVLMMLGLATVGFLMFSTDIEMFHTFHSSVLSIFWIISGTNKMSEIFTRYPFISTYFLFMVSEIVKHISFWILLAIFFDHFSLQYKIYLDSANKDRGSFFYLHLVISEKWHMVKTIRNKEKQEL